MDWDAARAQCKEKNWKWTLDLIDKYQKEMEDVLMVPNFEKK